LLPNIIRHGGKLRLADRECRETILPRKRFEARQFFVKTFRRDPLQVLDRFAQRQRTWEGNERVDMIFETADLDRPHTMFPRDAAEDFPYTCLDVVFKPALPILCAENDVAIKRRVGVRHGAMFNR
jgi:hypothetical protein